MVTVAEESRKLLDMYINIIRPIVVKICDKNPRSCFITYGGNRTRIGSRVTEFYETSTRFRLTTNSFRSLVETAFEELHQAGTIDNSTRSAVMNLNGHNHATAKRYYVQRDRHNEVDQASRHFPHFPPEEQDNADADYDGGDNDGDQGILIDIIIIYNSIYLYL